MYEIGLPLFEVTSIALDLAHKRLTTAANVRALIGSAPADDTTVVEPLIDRASAAMADYARLAVALDGRPPTFAAETCQATWFVQNYDQRADPLLGGLRRGPLRLPWRVPVTAIASVVENGVTLVNGSDYQLKAGGLVDRLSSATPIQWSTAKIVVIYTAGFPTLLSANVPPDLEAGCIEQVKYWYAARKRDPTIASEQVPDVYQASYKVPTGSGSNLLPFVESALVSYMNFSVT